MFIIPLEILSEDLLHSSSASGYNMIHPVNNPISGFGHPENPIVNTFGNNGISETSNQVCNIYLMVIISYNIDFILNFRAKVQKFKLRVTKSRIWKLSFKKETIMYKKIQCSKIN